MTRESTRSRRFRALLLAIPSATGAPPAHREYGEDWLKNMGSGLTTWTGKAHFPDANERLEPHLIPAPR